MLENVGFICRITSEASNSEAHIEKLKREATLCILKCFIQKRLTIITFLLKRLTIFSINLSEAFNSEAFNHI